MPKFNKVQLFYMENRWQESTPEQIAQDLDLPLQRVQNFIKKKQKEAKAVEAQIAEEQQLIAAQNKTGIKPANQNLKSMTVPGHKGMAVSSQMASEVADEFAKNLPKPGVGSAYHHAVTKAIDD